MVALRSHTRAELRHRGERVTVLSRPEPDPAPLTALEAQLIQLTYLLASIVDPVRELASEDRYYTGQAEYWQRQVDVFEWALASAWDLLRAVRSGRFEWDGDGRMDPASDGFLAPSAFRDKVKAVMSDGAWWTAEMVAERLGVPRRKAVVEMCALTTTALECRDYPYYRLPLERV